MPMGSWYIYYVDDVKRPEEWLALLNELAEMDAAPRPLYSAEDAAEILEKMCREHKSAIVVKLTGELYALPNKEIILIEGDKPEKTAKFTALRDIVVKRLDAKYDEIRITRENGFRNFAKDLFEGRVKLSDPWWVMRLKILAIAVTIFALSIYFNFELPIPEMSHETRAAIKLGLLGIFMLIGLIRGYTR